MAQYVEIYCNRLSLEEWRSRFWKKGSASRHKTGLALAEKQNGEWICLHCRKPVRVVA